MKTLIFFGFMLLFASLREVQTQGDNDQCTGGRVWNECGSACPPTCGPPQEACTLQCVAGCFCPDDNPIWYIDRCIQPSQCPGWHCRSACSNMTSIGPCTALDPIRMTSCVGYCPSGAGVHWDGILHKETMWWAWDIHKYCYCCQPTDYMWHQVALECTHCCKCSEAACICEAPHFNEIAGACLVDQDAETQDGLTLGECQDQCMQKDWCESCQFQDGTPTVCSLSPLSSRDTDYLRQPCPETGYNLYDKVVPIEGTHTTTETLSYRTIDECECQLCEHNHSADDGNQIPD